MKKLLVALVLGIFMISLVLAANGAQMQAAGRGATGCEKGTTWDEDQEKCNSCSEREIPFLRGPTWKCVKFEEGNMLQNRTRARLNLSNGRNAEIKIMPNTASETALARLRLRNCNESNKCTIELKEVGKGNETRAAYEVQVQRHFRILGMFRTKANVRAQIDAENGEVIRTNKPWWAFLASEPSEIEEE
jgi:hypothetical protein